MGADHVAPSSVERTTAKNELRVPFVAVSIWVKKSTTVPSGKTTISLPMVCDIGPGSKKARARLPRLATIGRPSEVARAGSLGDQAVPDCVDEIGIVRIGVHRTFVVERCAAVRDQSHWRAPCHTTVSRAQHQNAALGARLECAAGE